MAACVPRPSPWTVYGGVKWLLCVPLETTNGRAVHGHLFTVAAAGVNETKLSPGQGEKPRKCAVSRVLGPMWRADAVSRVLVRPMRRAQSRNAEASARE